MLLARTAHGRRHILLQRPATARTIRVASASTTATTAGAVERCQTAAGADDYVHALRIPSSFFGEFYGLNEWDVCVERAVKASSL